MRYLKIIILVGALASLAACGVGEFFIKRAVNNMEDDIADELRSYARFNQEQQQKIDSFAYKTAVWIRTVRLPILIEQLELVARDIEGSGAISEPTWRSFVLFMEDPLAFTEAPELVDDLALLAHGLSEEQEARVLETLNEKHEERMQERAEDTDEDQLDKLVKGVKTVFNEIGIERSREQLTTARGMLEKRRSYLELETQMAQRNYARLVTLLKSRDSALEQYRNGFKSEWKAADQSPIEMVPQDWAHNFRVSHSMMNFLLQDLSADERRTAALNIRRYAALFTELAVVEQ